MGSVPPGVATLGAVPTFSFPAVSADGLVDPLPRLFGESSNRERPEAAQTSPYYFLHSPPPTSAVSKTTPQPASATPLLARRTFDVRDVRRDFPILEERVHGRQLVWLDNAATTQKPRAVIDRLVHFYSHEYSNVHRAAHTLAARSTDAYEGAREKVQRFLGAGAPSEIVFVRGTTEGVNLIANAWGRKNIGAGDEIVLTTLEHHSNIVPWQFLADAVGAKLRIVPVTDRGEVRLGEYEKLLGTRTKLVAVTHVSNALGTILPVREMTQSAHRHGARVLIDGAQAVSHFPVNVQDLDADFYVLSGHKLFAPTGVGVVYGKKALLDEMPPWQGGGNMIQNVTFEESTFADAPARFEAGTATLADAVGLGAAVDYLQQLGMENVQRHEQEILAHATEALGRIAGVTLVGTAPDKAGVQSFIVDGIPAEEMGSLLDQEGIAVRAGHHCAQPTMARFGVTSTVRPSFALYNTHEEVELLERAIRRILAR
jgi:cysteine desulfurase/selenocysteine lyase